MAGKKKGGRPQLEVARERERRAWELRCKGWTLARIAADLNVDESTVHYALKRTRRQYLDAIKDDIEAYKVEQAAQLQHIADEAYQAWQRSKLDAVRITETVRPPHDGQGAGLVETETETKGQSGDVRYLEQARAALADIRKVWGIDAPAKSATTRADGSDLPDATEIELAVAFRKLLSG